MERIGRSLLRDAAYDRLRDAIVDGTLRPGAALRTDELAGRLGLSRAPIREAIARLTAEGLVETKPQSYTRVTALVEKDVEDAADVVGAMHDLAVRSAAGRLTDAQVAGMRAANERFAAAVRAGDLDAALDADDELHAVPVLACGNAAAALTIERFAPLIRRAERLLWASPSGEAGGEASGEASGEGSIRRHERLIAALAAGDGSRAAEINRTIWGHVHHRADHPQGDDHVAG